MEKTKKYSSGTASRYKQGIDYQRERFKSGKSGTGINNYDLMADSLENLKSDIKQKALNGGFDQDIERIEKILKQYRTLEAKHTKPSENGNVVVYPPGMSYKVNLGLTQAYESIMKILTGLDLL